MLGLAFICGMLWRSYFCQWELNPVPHSCYTAAIYHRATSPAPRNNVLDFHVILAHSFWGRHDTVEKNKRPFLSWRSFPKQVRFSTALLYICRHSAQGSWGWQRPWSAFSRNLGKWTYQTYSASVIHNPWRLWSELLCCCLLWVTWTRWVFWKLRPALVKAASALTSFITLGHPWSWFCSLLLQDIASLGA